MATQATTLELFYKMSGEQVDYHLHLLSLSPEEILEHAYEFTVREKIMESVAQNDMPDKLVQILMKSDTPLKDVFQYYEKMGIGYTPDYWCAVVGTANKALREEFIKRRQQER